MTGKELSVFQSPDRDSVCSSLLAILHYHAVQQGFNPLIGILFVQAQRRRPPK